MKLSELRRKLLERIDPVDVRIILRLATGLDDIHQITESQSEVSAEAEALAAETLERRLSGIPMAYITGEKEFYGHTFKVTEDTLIPRPDTETLVDAVIALSRRFSNPSILDLCTGSGAVAASVAAAISRPAALSDVSAPALAVARENYRRITGQEPEWREGDLLEPWKGRKFDIIASNPPYLTEEWYEETDKDVKAEPSLAFIGGGSDGLELIRKIIAESRSCLSPGGWLVLECDYRQTEICGTLLRKAGFGDVTVLRDLAGKERVVYGRGLPQ